MAPRTAAAVLRATASVNNPAASCEALRSKALDGRYTPRCGVCGQRARYRDTRRARRLRHVPLWGIDVHLVYAPRRVMCEHCGGIHVELLPWVAGKRQFTRALMVTLVTWAWVLTWK